MHVNTFLRKKNRALRLASVVAAALGGLAACTPAPDEAPLAPVSVPSALSPQGPAAAQIETLWWGMFWAATVIFIFVMVLLAWGLSRRRSPAPHGSGADGARRGDPERGLPGGANTWVLGGGVIMPAVVLTTLLGFTLGVMRTTASSAPAGQLVVEVIGHQWWWEVRYPEAGFTTANEIRIPVGQPVQLQLTSADVIHSFWAPELHGKMDLIPGRTNTWVIQADRAGDYQAECAEFCGLQHAKMQLVVVAETPEDFTAWLAAQQQPAAEPADDIERTGQQVFLGSACVYCHTVRGTNASGTVGPDLTHLASRRTLAAGILPNTRGHLAGWILDPQNLKPGNLMPPTHLSGEELNLLLAYLESLQ